ncbi:MAG: hypothetical protein CTY34_06595 [Methylobacter sp.]|nr:MAG: hypothetical protein CTY34_06595 [Methylobacter sp.]PPD24239.1 MAG: hypothetical protein CTY24_01720 [Methylobacter sp.]PPD37606.1 MAG: hypothetical protein CTY18_01460 [Methylomonas sp.]
MARKSLKAVRVEDQQPVSSTVDHDDEQLFEDGEEVYSDSTVKSDSKMDARRKIEIYWEKKQLREQFEDFDESEFGF